MNTYVSEGWRRMRSHPGRRQSPPRGSRQRERPGGKVPGFICHYQSTRDDPAGIEFLTAMADWMTDVSSDLVW